MKSGQLQPHPTGADAAHGYVCVPYMEALGLMAFCISTSKVVLRVRGQVSLSYSLTRGPRTVSFPPA